MSNPPRLTDLKREAILAAAIAEFRSNGFEATSMDKIAATADVSKRTVYNHFPSKDDLFAAILVQLWQKTAETNELSYRPDQPLRPQLLALVQQKMRMMNDAHFMDLARVAIAAAIHSPERARGMIDRMDKREEGMTTWIRAAQADSKLKKTDPEFAAHLLQGQLKSFAFWPQLAMGQTALDEKQQAEVVQIAVDMFLGYFEIKS
ncbi:TetR/AcrR family transcriptional regulator [Undibacterium terreum]|uniref:TetR family transcriptional regulator n=1 Tax=Undibacterium terreum TaxID=1224302 RepID=A0A916UKA5_9BURK|nr:TetR/AcrR family transcriptional regulator [Undibacterium terreum]GGC75761.1 TetR family transcriptional regulator [Undibacterium terreum]